eukprot:CAMPEP_0197503282 /NCGR_PEP_ID=MMETSP1312-20131121/2501_1 /TAXON_ID=464262 /ORGANISM="Genus nov. species nov., Strain RCC2335" /LENGTH=271 /DNA_ID=CAMNT_0043049887 /DNA_START=44 /DNA_END=859 /DNA_ORIENTATION=+
MTEAVSSDAEEGPGVVVASSKDPMAAARLARSPCWLGGSGSSPNSTDHLPVASECEWRWETPYYAASTMVECACLDRGSALWSRGAPQAFVGIFDASCEENWSDLQRALTSPEHSQALGEVEVKLVAADFGPRDAMCGSLNRQDEDSWVSRCYDWCLERGYEYVEVCTADDGVDASLTLFGDRQGCGRIVEALHCHRWPGAELRPLPGAAEVRGEDEEEREQEDFEDLLATVASARAEGASLPDDQRRKNAEAMLFKILGHLGIDDEDDEV